MTEYGYCYSPTGSRCTGGPQPGTLALWRGVVAVFPVFGTLGIYNCRPVRGGGSLSTHGEGRGWDCKCNANDPKQKAAGDMLAALLVKNATKLGVQRVIWNRRQWDSKTKTWRAYGGVSPHTDHLHIELCWAAAAGPKKLTQTYVEAILRGQEEDDLAQVPQDEWNDVVADVAGLKSDMAALRNVVGTKKLGGSSVMTALIKRIPAHDANGNVIPNASEDVEAIDYFADIILAELSNVSTRLEAIEQKLSEG